MKEQPIKTFSRLTKDYEYRQNIVNPKWKVVHAIYDSRNEAYIAHFFESEHLEYFQKFRELQKNNPSLELFGAWLRLPKADAKAKETWEYNNDYLHEHHASFMTWHDDYQDWML